MSSVVFDEVNKEISLDNTFASTNAGSRNCVRTKGAGSDSFQQIETNFSLSGEYDFMQRTIVRTSKGVIYAWYQNGNTCMIFKSTDEGQTFSGALDPSSDPQPASAGCGVIDANDQIHIFASGSEWIFDTTDDTWGSETAIDTGQGGKMACGIDSQGFLHVVYAFGNSARYTNNIGGSYRTYTLVESEVGSDPYQLNLDFDSDDVPYIQASWDLQGTSPFQEIRAYKGNQNDATSWEGFTVQTISSFQGFGGLIVTKQNTVIIGYDDSGEDITVRRHIHGKSWSTWETVQQLDSSDTFGDCNFSMDGAGDIYFFYTTTGLGDFTYYRKSTNNGIDWGSEVTNRITTGNDQFCRSRYQRNFQYFPNKIDLMANVSTDQMWYDMVLAEPTETWRSIETVIGSGFASSESGARSTVRTSTGILYNLSRQTGSNDLVMRKSTNEGESLTEVDSGSAPTGADTDAVACAIDSTGIIHVVFWNDGTGLRYVTFDTSDDTWGTPETAQTELEGASSPLVAITIDSADKPHACYQDDNFGIRFFYTNKISGWSSKKELTTTSGYFGVDMTINDDDIPQVCLTNDFLTDDVTVYLGNLNNPVSFSSHDLSTSAVDSFFPSMVVDKKGDTYVSLIESGDVKVYKHLKANAWSSWETVVNVVTGTFEDTSMLLDADENPIIFTTNSSNVTFAYKSTDGGATWSALDTSHDSAGVTDNHIRTRWSFLNYYFPSQFDYTMNNGNNLHYNKMVQSGSNHLYVVGRNQTDSDIELWYSPTEGATWELLDPTGEPTVDDDNVSCAIDSLDNIHINFWDDGTGQRYVVFDTSNDTYGSPETIFADTSTVGSGKCGITIDSQDVPHVTVSNKGTGGVELGYTNRIGGTWKATVDLSTVESSRNVDITISPDDVPIIISRRASAYIRVYLGNVRDATTFEEFDVSIDPEANEQCAVAVDSVGNVHVTWIEDTEFLKYRKHNVGDAWSTWQSTIQVQGGNLLQEASILVDGKQNIVIFCTSAISDDTLAYISTNGGSSFDSGTQHDTGLVEDHIRTRWSFLNYYNPNKYDYTVYDQSAVETFYNSASEFSEPIAPLGIKDETESIAEASPTVIKTGIHFAGGKVLVS